MGRVRSASGGARADRPRSPVLREGRGRARLKIHIRKRTGGVVLCLSSSWTRISCTRRRGIIRKLIKKLPRNLRRSARRAGSGTGPGRGKSAGRLSTSRRGSHRCRKDEPGETPGRAPPRKLILEEPEGNPFLADFYRIPGGTPSRPDVLPRRPYQELKQKTQPDLFHEGS